MEVNLEKWQVSSKDDSFIFIPEFGRLSLIRSVDSKRLLLPDQELKGYFMANIFYSDYLLIIYSQSVMVINTKSMESSSYTFDFALNNAQMASENTIVLEKEDGDNVTFDRSSLMFV